MAPVSTVSIAEMNFYIEWALAVHRAVWFPLNWALGLERPPEEIPLDIGPRARDTKAAPRLVSIRKVSRRRRSAVRLRSKAA
jgi:hypothetical protein